MLRSKQGRVFVVILLVLALVVAVAVIVASKPKPAAAQMPPGMYEAPPPPVVGQWTTCNRLSNRPEDARRCPT